jgi:hypothetical protein
VADAVAVVIGSNGQLGTISSSRRYKEEISDMNESSSGLLQLRPVTFRYTKEYADGTRPLEYGLVAEEVAEVYPDLVTYSPAGNPEAVQYHKLSVMLLNEMQKQHRQIQGQREELAQLRARLEALEQPLRRLRARERCAVLPSGGPSYRRGSDLIVHCGSLSLESSSGLTTTLRVLQPSTPITTARTRTQRLIVPSPA